MKHLYVVMDGRAQFDTDSAAVLECCGNKKPSWKSLREDWGKQGSVLVRYQVISDVTGEYCDHPEIVGVIN